MNKVDFLLPKTKIYWCDGTGRDSYIFLNNGGFSHKFYKPPIQNTRACQSIPEIKSEIMPKQVHYHSNGTGRDQHIIYNEGGFCQNYSPEKIKFSANLRKYEKMPSLTHLGKPDYFSECQIRLNPKEQYRQNQLFVSQQNFTERMSIPKINYQKLFQEDTQLRKMYEGIQDQNQILNQKINSRRPYLRKILDVSPLQVAQKELMRNVRNNSIGPINQ